MSMRFDGVDDYAFVVHEGGTLSAIGNNHLGASATAQFSIGQWFYAYSPGEANTGALAMLAGTGQTQSIKVETILSGKISAFYNNTGATDSITKSVSGTYKLNQWNYLVTTYSGGSSTTAGAIYLYLNGNEVTYGTQTTGAGGPGINFAGTGWLFGGNQGTQTFDGLIDYIQFWDRVIGLEEIRESMYFPGSIRQNLTAFYRLGSQSLVPNESFGSRKSYALNSIGAIEAPSPPIGRYPKIRRNRFAQNLPVSIGGQSYIVNLSDNITIITNTIYKDFLKYLSQSVTLTEAHYKDYLKYITQSVTLTETHYKDFLKYILQSVTLSESISTVISGLIQLAFSDALTVSAVHYKDFLKYITQSVTISEAIAKDFLKYIAQQITVSSVHYKDYLKYISQSVSVTEIQYKDYLKYISQLITVSETSNFTFITAIIRQITFDTLRKQIKHHELLDMQNDSDILEEVH